MEKTTAVRKAYYPALDGLRLFAMLGVLAYHYAPAHCPGGFLGVDVFLVISGFLLTRSLLERHPEGFKRWYARYLLRRVLRLGVPMLVMFLTAIAIINAFYSELLYNVRGALISSLFFANNWWQIAQGSSYFQAYVHPSAFTHLWYIAVLMQICLIWPLLIALVLRQSGSRQMVFKVSVGVAVASALAMALLYHSGNDPSRIYYGTDTRLYAFALGSALAALPGMDQGRRRRRSALPPAAMEAVSLVLLLGLLFMSMHLFDQSKWTYRGGLFLSAILAALLVGALTRRTAVARILGARPLALAGKCTYSCYLWYYPVLTLGNATPFLANKAWLQWIILAALSFLTYLFAEQKLTQSLMRGHLPHLEAIKNLPAQLRSSWPALIAAVVCLAMAVSTVVGLVRAPSGDNQTVAEMEAQIAENQRILAEQQAQRDRDELASSGSVDWLSPSIQLFCRDSSTTFVGDSILLAAAKPLSQIFPNAVIDGKVGRQLNQSVDLIQSLRDEGKLGDIVVVVLGSNGSFTDDQFKSFMELISDKTVFLVNTSEPRPWQEEVNKKLAACADEDDKDNIYLIDWKTLIDQHPEWLYEDMTHTNEEGAQEFAALIATEMYNTLVDEDQRAKDAEADAYAKESSAEQSSSDQDEDEQSTEKQSSADQDEQRTETASDSE